MRVSFKSVYHYDTQGIVDQKLGYLRLK
jgi:hypothetical protein